MGAEFREKTRLRKFLCQNPHFTCVFVSGKNPLKKISVPEPSFYMCVRLILVINFILRENSGKVLSADMKCDG